MQCIHLKQGKLERELERKREKERERERERESEGWLKGCPQIKQVSKYHRSAEFRQVIVSDCTTSCLN